jgi:hypothetical protein
MSSWTELLECAKPEEHVVQLYGSDEQLLVRNVSRYLAEGFKRGDGLVMIATREHTEAVVRQLREEGADAPAALRDGRFVCLDARATLDRFLVDGQPDWKLFESVVGGVLQDVKARAGSGKIRAFGEMVGLLWIEGHVSAAIRLEEYWNDLLKGSPCSLFCAYPIDIFGEHFEMATLGTVLGTHTHLLAGPQTMFSSARAVD